MDQSRYLLDTMLQQTSVCAHTQTLYLYEAVVVESCLSRASNHSSIQMQPLRSLKDYEFM